MLDEKILIEKEENIKRFWLSFTTWFKEELPGTKILRSHYECSDNWNGGSYHLNIDFEKPFFEDVPFRDKDHIGFRLFFEILACQQKVRIHDAAVVACAFAASSLIMIHVYDIIKSKKRG